MPEKALKSHNPSCLHNSCLEKPANLSVYLLYQILRIEFELQPALSGTNVDIGELQAGFVNIGRERLFHADRRTTAADIDRKSVV